MNITINGKNSHTKLGGGILGIILIVVGSILLWTNESNSVKNIRTVKEVTDTAISVPSDNVSTENNGKLVVTSGDLNVIDDEVMDQNFNVGIKTPVLRRVVEMYQWEENETETSDNSVRYTYTRDWSEKLIDSSYFHDSMHENPTSKLYDNDIFTAGQVKIGNFELSEGEKASLETDKELDLSAVTTLPDGFTKYDKYITNAPDMQNPSVGDIRIYYEYNDWTSATVLAVQNNNTFTPYTSKAGKSVDRVFEGTRSKDDVVDQMTAENDILKWTFRIVGILLVVIGYMALLNPLNDLIAKIPIFGDIVNSAINGIAGLIGLSQALLVIAIAWFVYRPLLSLGLLALIVLLVLLIVKLCGKKKDKVVNGVNQVMQSNPADVVTNMMNQNMTNPSMNQPQTNMNTNQVNELNTNNQTMQPNQVNNINQVNQPDSINQTIQNNTNNQFNNPNNNQNINQN